MRRSPHVVVALCTFVIAALLTPATARTQGQVWIVDHANGPGTNFLDIPPALQAAQSGDKVFVRAGTYGGGVIDKGITVLAEPGATVRVYALANANATFDVRDLALGETVVLGGFTPALTSSPPLPYRFVLLTDCAGHVHLDRLRVALGNPFTVEQNSRRAFELHNCAHVTIHACSATRGMPVQASNSTLLITDSTLAGEQGVSYPGGNFTSSQPGMIISDCTLTLSHTSVHGGDEVVLRPPSAQPAIIANRSQIVIAGPTGTEIHAGAALYTSSSAIAGGASGGATILVDPRVSLQSSGGAPLVAPAHVLTYRSIPSMSATGAPPGGTMSADLLASSGDLAQIYAGLPYGPIAPPVASWGPQWVDFSGVVVLGTFAVPASEHVVLSFPVSSNPVVQGLPLTFQALTLTPGVGFELSTPVTPVMN